MLLLLRCWRCCIARLALTLGSLQTPRKVQGFTRKLQAKTTTVARKLLLTSRKRREWTCDAPVIHSRARATRDTAFPLSSENGPRVAENNGLAVGSAAIAVGTHNIHNQGPLCPSLLDRAVRGPNAGATCLRHHRRPPARLRVANTVASGSPRSGHASPSPTLSSIRFFYTFRFFLLLCRSS